MFVSERLSVTATTLNPGLQQQPDPVKIGRVILIMQCKGCGLMLNEGMRTVCGADSDCVIESASPMESYHGFFSLVSLEHLCTPRLDASLTSARAFRFPFTPFVANPCPTSDDSNHHSVSQHDDHFHPR